MKFKVGDKVVLVKILGYSFDKIGMTGKITWVDSVDDFAAVMWLGVDGASWPYHTRHLSHITLEQTKAEV